ncbi:methylated-DNA--[protein]-cysteine S-methyltransferase [Proteiniborus sp.]|uniref:methylated-DNA--[protein]-cysteine S-methyltransferase n=1 Tax=Proteiniborus sp. TaxID=2079015 RepID=UPI0033192CA8
MRNYRKIYYESMQTDIGNLWIGFTSKGLARLEFFTSKDQFINDLKKDYGHIVECQNEASDYNKQINLYLEKKLEKFELPLDLKGTDFQMKVWKELLKIPYGEVKSYKDIAIAVGRSKGFRAVGMANNRNPVSIVVPCHRVIGSSGELVGYGGGIETKVKLLKLEGLNIIEKERNGKKLYFVA